MLNHPKFPFLNPTDNEVFIVTLEDRLPTYYVINQKVWDYLHSPIPNFGRKSSVQDVVPEDLDLALKTNIEEEEGDDYYGIGLTVGSAASDRILATVSYLCLARLSKLSEVQALLKEHNLTIKDETSSMVY